MNMSQRERSFQRFDELLVVGLRHTITITITLFWAGRHLQKFSSRT